jgi:sugar phosphate isomerase/epimerase
MAQISRASLDQISLSFASVSVGAPSDPLPKKLQAIAAAGFQAIELGFPDLLSFASSHHKKEIEENDYENLCIAGAEVKKLCQYYGLDILMLQPFSNFEGWAEFSKEREDAFDRAKGWIQIMGAVGTDMLQASTNLVRENGILANVHSRLDLPIPPILHHLSLFLPMILQHWQTF